MDRLALLEHQIGQKAMKLAEIKQNESDKQIVEYLNKISTINAIMRVFLVIHHAELIIQYPKFTITTNTILGSSNASVYPATLINDDETVKISVAAKLVSNERFSMQEIRYTSLLDSPRVMRLYGICMCQSPENHSYIFMERLDTNLSDYLQLVSGKNNLHEKTVDHIVKQIVEGLDSLHESNIIHRDIKPENILLKLTKNQLPDVKISDFGCVHQLPVSLQGTTGYIAPELLCAPEEEHSLLIGIKSDVYALGVTIQQILEIPHSQDAGHFYKFWLEIANRCQRQKAHERPSCKSILNDREQVQC
jgi:serine/threonine protein kinase